MQETRLSLQLVGRGGEPVDLPRTILSHGFASLPPMRVDGRGRWLEVTLPLRSGRPRTVRVEQSGPGLAAVEVVGPRPGSRQAREIVGAVGHVLRLDEDLSEFYANVARDPDLSWAVAGAGRMIRSSTVFEDVVKTVCTTNCAWSGTERMVGALVQHLGEAAPGAPAGPYGRAFPTPEAMASAGEAFYTDVVRAGYRGRYLRELATSVAEGRLDLQALGRASRDELPDDELAARLLALPGVGPYAAAHILMMLGRYSRLILDSWTRPKYRRLSGARRASDSTIERRFRRYGPQAGLAFWLYVTRDWL